MCSQASLPLTHTQVSDLATSCNKEKANATSDSCAQRIVIRNMGATARVASSACSPAQLQALEIPGSFGQMDRPICTCIPDAFPTLHSESNGHRRRLEATRGNAD